MYAGQQNERDNSKSQIGNTTSHRGFYDRRRAHRCRAGRAGQSPASVAPLAAVNMSSPGRYGLLRCHPLCKAKPILAVDWRDWIRAKRLQLQRLDAECPILGAGGKANFGRLGRKKHSTTLGLRSGVEMRAIRAHQACQTKPIFAVIGLETAVARKSKANLGGGSGFDLGYRASNAERRPRRLTRRRSALKMAAFTMYRHREVYRSRRETA